MKGLILKDFYAMRQQLRIYFIILAFWLFLAFQDNNASFFGGVTAFFSVMIPVSAIAYDEQAHWDKYALTMPVSRTQMVVSKYLLTILCIFVCGVLSFATSCIISKNVSESVMTTLMFMSIGLFFASIIFPAIFKLGVEKGRMVLIGIAVLPTLLLTAVSKLDFPKPDPALVERAFYLAPAVAVVVLILSILLSVHIYKNIEF